MLKDRIRARYQLVVACVECAHEHRLPTDVDLGGGTANLRDQNMRLLQGFTCEQCGWDAADILELAEAVRKY